MQCLVRARPFTESSVRALRRVTTHPELGGNPISSEDKVLNDESIEWWVRKSPSGQDTHSSQERMLTINEDNNGDLAWL